MYTRNSVMGTFFRDLEQEGFEHKRNWDKKKIFNKTMTNEGFQRKRTWDKKIFFNKTMTNDG